MRVASDATIERAARLRRGGKSWLQLTGTEESKKASLDFWRGARPGQEPKR